MDKEMFIAAHEELIEQYLNDHPDATDHEAYQATADHVYDRYRDKWADVVDGVRDQTKYGRG